MFFNSKGVYGLVDGQYGSTGKGVLGAYLVRQGLNKVDLVVSNAGPNSGHTFYHENEKVVLKQLPTFAVAAKRLGRDIPIYLDSGAIIDPDILNAEIEKHGIRKLWLSPTAAVISAEDKASEHSGTVAAVAGTRQGVGAALSRKVLRDPEAVARAYTGWHPNIVLSQPNMDWSAVTTFMEVSQGFSLGYHSTFYPKTTSRECTITQGLTDARIPPQLLRRTAMVIRTFPIRVGNHEGFSSGDCYPDQKETSWEELGVTAETTTVTGRVRRVFTFSDTQFVEALRANYPQTILVNFMNYLDEKNQKLFAKRVESIARKVLPFKPTLLWGFGPTSNDVRRAI